MTIKRLILGLLLLLSTGLFAQSTTRDIDNPQLSMVGARHLSLGGVNPAVPGDINGLFINPAAIGTFQPMPFAITQRRILGDIDILMVHAAFPGYIPLYKKGRIERYKVNFGVSYGENKLKGIPSTVLEDDIRIRQVGNFSSGFSIMQFTVGKEFTDLYSFDTIGVGGAFKRIGQNLAGQTRSTYSADLGVMATRYLGLDYVDKVTIGGSVINLIPASLSWGDGQGKANIPFDIFLGAKVDLFQEKLSVFANNTKDGFAVGTEYVFVPAFVLRGSSDFKNINLGTGLLFEDVAGIGINSYSMRLDFNYTQNTFPLENDPSYAISLTMIGSSRPQTPRILSPATNVTIQTKAADISGTGPKSTTIRIYNNDSLVRTTNTDRFGQWSFKNLPLKEGDNKLRIKAYSLFKDYSVASDELKITSDTTPPTLNVAAYPDGPWLIVRVSAKEKLSEIEGTAVGRRLLFKPVDEVSWEAKAELPPELAPNSPPPAGFLNIELTAADSAGNTSSKTSYPFYIALEFPKDKTVHYRDRIRFIGKASPMAKDIFVNGEKAQKDTNGSFAVSVPLKAGKNLVRVSIATGEKNPQNHSLRVLRLVSFPDLVNDGGFSQIKERREIEFLATLGVLHGDEDGYFYPNRAVTRRYITEILVKNLQLPLSDVTEDVFPDVPRTDRSAQIIKTAIENGLVYAFPDGRFKPNQELTMSEALFMLSSAGFLEAGTRPSTPDNGFVTRKALAQFLAYSPKYEIQIERLIDWERGYN